MVWYFLLFVFFSFLLFLINLRFKKGVKGSILEYFDREKMVEIDIGKFAPGQKKEVEVLLSELDVTLRICSYNMLFGSIDPNLPHHHRWKKRLPRIVSILGDMRPDIICCQELDIDQSRGLLSHLSEVYDCCDFFNHNDCKPIYYSKERLRCLESRYIYFSEHQEAESCDPYGCLHGFSFAKFVDKLTGEKVCVLNTHFSFYGAASREYAVNFIVEFLKGISGLSVVLCGDFNTFPFYPDMPNLPYYDGDYIRRLLQRAALCDAMDKAILGHVGPLSTFTNAPKNSKTKAFRGLGTPGVILDHFFVNDYVKVARHGIEPAKVDGFFPSDHMPIIADILLISDR